LREIMHCVSVANGVRVIAPGVGHGAGIRQWRNRQKMALMKTQQCHNIGRNNNISNGSVMGIP